MKLQEALNVLNNTKFSVSNEAEEQKCRVYQAAFKTAIEALEKQIPKKVTHESTLYKCCTCPNCKNVVDKFTDFAGQRVRVTYNYCRICGQALDWSDTE